MQQLLDSNFETSYKSTNMKMVREILAMQYAESLW